MVPTVALDGAFQTASFLFRLNQSHFPGRDFYPYLGIFPSFLLYPPFVIFGANLASSVLSSYLVTFLIGFMVLLLGLVLNVEISRRSIIYASVLLYLLVDYLNPGSYFYIASFYQDPGHSIRPVRSFAPYFILFSYLLISKVTTKRTVKLLLLGAAMGIVLVWSNDYAFITFFVFLVFVSFLDLKSKGEFFILFFSSILFFLLWISLFTMFRPIEMLHYNLIDVRRDQWWYFAPYDTGRAWRIDDILRFDYIIIPALIYLSIFFFASIYSRNRRRIFWSFVGINLFLGGAITSWIGFYTGYYHPFLFWFTLTLSIELFSHLVRFAGLNFEGRFFRLLALLLITCAVLHRFFLLSEKDSEIANRGFVFVEELGGYIGKEYIDYINFIKSMQDYDVIEDYFGIWGAVRKKNSNWRVDSIIHALGKARIEAKSAIHKVDILITTRRDSTLWSEWIFAQNLWFYEEIKDFVPYYVSPSSVVWKRLEFGEQEEKYVNDCRIRKITESFYRIEVDIQDKDYYVVDIEYNFKGLRNLLLVRNEKDPLTKFVSLDPNSDRFSFPIFINHQFLDMRVFGWEGYRLDFKSCRLSSIGRMSAYVDRLQDFFVTDENWSQGIARRWAGFYLPALHNYINKFRVGEEIVLPNGQKRRIVHTEINGPFYNIFLEGEVLNTEVVPSPLVITREFFLTDQNWNRGISRWFSGFFVPNTPYYRNLYRIGDRIEVQKGDIRYILNTEEADDTYLYVILSGDIIEVGGDMNPFTFRLLSSED